MNERTLYFAYGSNMAAKRLKARVQSAQQICVAILEGHQLKFHKVSKKDGSGKCDAARTGKSNDKVFGVLYSLQTSELPELDRFEGQGYGYERRQVTVCSTLGESVKAETYIATNTDISVRPLDWYKEHVLRGAKACGLPPDYIAMIDAVVADADPDEERRARELAIYS